MAEKTSEPNRVSLSFKTMKELGIGVTNQIISALLKEEKFLEAYHVAKGCSSVEGFFEQFETVLEKRSVIINQQNVGQIGELAQSIGLDLQQKINQLSPLDKPVEAGRLIINNLRINTIFVKSLLNQLGEDEVLGHLKSHFQNSSVGLCLPIMKSLLKVLDIKGSPWLQEILEADWSGVKGIQSGVHALAVLPSASLLDQTFNFLDQKQVDFEVLLHGKRGALVLTDEPPEKMKRSKAIRSIDLALQASAWDCSRLIMERLPQVSAVEVWNDLKKEDMSYYHRDEEPEFWKSIDAHCEAIDLTRSVKGSFKKKATTLRM